MASWASVTITADEATELPQLIVDAINASDDMKRASQVRVAMTDQKGDDARAAVFYYNDQAAKSSEWTFLMDQSSSDYGALVSYAQNALNGLNDNVDRTAVAWTNAKRHDSVIAVFYASNA